MRAYACCLQIRKIFTFQELSGDEINFCGFMFSGAMFNPEIFQSIFRDDLHLKHVEATFFQTLWVFGYYGAWYLQID